MSYIYSAVESLDQQPLVGSHQCVALVQQYTSAGHTSTWRPGAAVVGNNMVAKGTAIATFVNNRYASAARGNHAALYVRPGPNGFWVMDQWANDPSKPTVSQRYIRSKGKNKDGTFADPSNNADAYSVIEAH